MPRKKTPIMKALMGRPKFEIDWGLFDRLAYLQCPLDEMAFLMGCHESTIERACIKERQMTFADLFRKRSAGGRAAIRRAMFEEAVRNKNPSMMIHLSERLKLFAGTKEEDIERNIDQIFVAEFGTLEVEDAKDDPKAVHPTPSSESDT